MTEPIVDIEERSDSIVATIDGVPYELSRELTGRQFIDLRRKAIKVIKGEKGSETTRIDNQEFDFWNVLWRFISPKLSDKELDALPRKVYQMLTLVGARLDRLEALGVADFLQNNSSFFQDLEVTLEPSLDSPQPTSEATSESEPEQEKEEEKV